MASAGVDAVYWHDSDGWILLIHDTSFPFGYILYIQTLNIHSTHTHTRTYTATSYKGKLLGLNYLHDKLLIYPRPNNDVIL